MAILAVLLDHSFGILYTNSDYQLGSGYSVSLFILISGLLTYHSIRRHNYSYCKTVQHSLKKIVIAYLIATLIYQVWAYKGFDLVRYVNGLIAFNASGPFYYVLLYIHLMLISKIIYSLIAFKTPAGLIKDVTVGYCIIAISYITTNYTNVLNVYGGGGKLLGGTFLFLFYLGMMFEKYKVFEKITLVKCLISVSMGVSVFLGGWIFGCNDRFKIDNLIHFGAANPPGITLMSLSFGMIFFCFGAFNVLNRLKFLTYIVRFVSWLGSHTLYIFLFHRFWLDYILCPYIVISDPCIRFIVYFAVMIVGSIIFEFAVSYIAQIYVRIAGKVKNTGGTDQADTLSSYGRF